MWYLLWVSLHYYIEVFQNVYGKFNKKGNTTLWYLWYITVMIRLVNKCFLVETKPFFGFCPLGFRTKGVVIYCCIAICWAFVENNNSTTPIHLQPSIGHIERIEKWPFVYQFAASMLLQSMDTRADPCEDFYQFTCGNWAVPRLLPENAPLSWFSERHRLLDQRIVGQSLTLSVLNFSRNP